MSTPIYCFFVKGRTSLFGPICQKCSVDFASEEEVFGFYFSRKQQKIPLMLNRLKTSFYQNNGLPKLDKYFADPNYRPLRYKRQNVLNIQTHKVVSFSPLKSEKEAKYRRLSAELFLLMLCGSGVSIFLLFSIKGSKLCTTT